MRPGRSSLPRFALLADPESDDIHRPMQGGRDKDDGEESEERVSREESWDGPRGNHEAEEERADDEIVLVEDRSLGPAGLVHPPLEEGPGEVPEECAEAEDRGGCECHAVRSEGPRRIRRNEVERYGQEESQERPRQGTTHEAPPGLPIAEEPLAIPQGSAEVDGRAPAEDDRHRVRDERGEEEPDGLRDRLEGHRRPRRSESRI